MMGAKVTKVRLMAYDDPNLTESFEVSHAERVLSIPNTCWQVAKDEKVEWNGNGFRVKQNIQGGTDSE